MATVTGPLDTGSKLQANRKLDMASKILDLEPSATPLTVLSAKLSKRKTSNPEYKWLENSSEPRFDAINAGAGYASGITALVVDNGAYFAQHDTVLVTRTGELMRVTSVVGNTINVVRGISTSGAAAAIVDNDELLIGASAQMEGDTSKPARSTNPTSVTNYTEIIREPFHITRTAAQSDSNTSPNDWRYLANRSGVEHKKEIEYALWFSKASEDLTGAHPRRTTGGVFQYVTSNLTDASGQLTEAELFNAIRPVYRYGGGDKWGFGSGLVIDVMQQFPRSKVQVINQGSGTYGLNVMRFISPHGALNLVTAWLLEGTKYGGVLAILDMDQISYRYLSNENGSSDTHIRTGIQINDEDGMKSEYLTECGLEFGLSQRHGLISGITSGPQS